MSVPKYRIVLAESEREELKRITRKQTPEQTIVRRARVILLADTGMANQDIAKELVIQHCDASPRIYSCG